MADIIHGLITTITETVSSRLELNPKERYVAVTLFPTYVAWQCWLVSGVVGYKATDEIFLNKTFVVKGSTPKATLKKMLRKVQNNDTIIKLNK